MHLKCIKLVILKIFFILGLRNFKFSFKIPWPHPTKVKISLPPQSPANTFLKFLTPHPPTYPLQAAADSTCHGISIP